MSPSPRIQRKRATARAEILDAARELLNDHGVDGVTLAAIGERLDLTKQAVYHYFPSKQALVKALALQLLSDEVVAILAAVEAAPRDPLAALIRAFYDHYHEDLAAFRLVYGETQRDRESAFRPDADTLADDVHPTTRALFDALEARLSPPRSRAATRRAKRRLAFSAWLAAMGLVNMLSIAEANNDPLIYSDEELLETLAATFAAAAR